MSTSIHGVMDSPILHELACNYVPDLHVLVTSGVHPGPPVAKIGRTFGAIPAYACTMLIAAT